MLPGFGAWWRSSGHSSVRTRTTKIRPRVTTTDPYPLFAKMSVSFTLYKFETIGESMDPGTVRHWV